MNIAEFTEEQLAGQRLMVGFDGTELNDDLIHLVDTVLVGGIILFSRNITSPDQVKALCKSLQKYAYSCGQPPLFVAIDQEGGEVSRLKKPFTQFPGNPAMKGEKDAEYFAEITGVELGQIGVNMNMAPVLDIACKGSIMAERSFGHDSARVSGLGLKVIEHLQKKGIMAVAKHFPGIGKTTLDSHLDIPFLDITMANLAEVDLLPFKAAIARDVGGIMLSHVLYRQIDSQWPASLSPCFVRKILRDEMKFEGIVITDDLDMGAIKKHHDIKTVIRQIIASDIDIALICHKSADIEKAFAEILNHVKMLGRKKMEASVKRIIKYKKKYIKNIRL